MKIIRAIAAISMMVAIAFPAYAHDFEDNGIYYRILSETDKTVAVTHKGDMASDQDYAGDIEIPAFAISSTGCYSIKSIDSYAFYNSTALTSVSIPNNTITEIGESAFSGCAGLTSVTIPNSVTSIGSDVFLNCEGLNEVHINSLIGWCEINFANIGSNPLWYAHNLYLNGELITEFEFPNSLNEIKDFTFAGCTKLTSVTIPNSVTNIGLGAFGFTGLTSVIIPNSVIKVGDSAFYECSELTSVTIPESVIELGAFSFDSCPKLKDVYISDIAAWCNMEIHTNFYLINLYLNGDLITDLVIPDAITKIRHNCFCFCECLESVTIPKSVTSIGRSAFRGCGGLSSIAIGTSVTSIEDRAFENCNNLKYIYYDAINVSNVGTNIFSSDNKISHIVIGEEVQKIPNGIFDNCNKVTTIISKNQNPPVCDVKAFNSADKSKCVLYASLDYCGADVWKDFTVIKTFVEISTLSFADSNFKMETNKNLQLEAIITPADASIKDLIWKSSNPEIAIVSDTGQIQGIAPGEATITAMTIDGSNLKAACSIIVSDFSGVEGIESDVCTVTVENGAIVVKNAVGAVTVHNLTGVAVASEQADGATLRIDCLQHGVYIVTVNGKATKIVL